MSALLTTVLRILVRSRLTRNLGWDDFWIVVCMISNIVGLGFVTAEMTDGLGRHMYYVHADQRRRFTIIGWLDWMQTFITIMFCKISICMFLLRIKQTKWNVRFMYSLIAANVIVTIVVTCLFIGICSPPDAYWIVGKSGKCMSNERIMAIVIAQGSEYDLVSSIADGSLKRTVFSALTDIVLATTPLLFLKDLQISPRTKICLCILMGAGYLCAACLSSQLNPQLISSSTAAASIVRTALSGALLETDATCKPMLSQRSRNLVILIYLIQTP